MTFLAKILSDRMRNRHNVEYTEREVDLILKERDHILKEDDKGPGFNRDTIGIKTNADGTITRYTKNNPR